MKFWGIETDDKPSWSRCAVVAAKAAGHDARLIQRGAEIDADGGYGFIRLQMDQRALARNRDDYAIAARRVTMIQDATQVRIYEDKSAQFALWSEWMPDTWRITNADEAMDFVRQYRAFPLVGKADVGASSVCVRILESRKAAEHYVEQIFSPAGLQLGWRNQIQRGYVLLQRFIPHKTTYRVNAIGNCRAVFFRHCYPDRPVAQTGNVDPAMVMTDELESLLDYADRFLEHAGTRWCAIDILRDESGWKLLETSQGWPWPSPGTCNEAPIFRSRNQQTWRDMFGVLMDEIADGTWLDT